MDRAPSGHKVAVTLGMAALLQLRFGDPEFGARIGGATEELHRTKSVMIAPVHVLHLPDPETYAIKVLGAERARELMAAGASISTDRIVEEVLAAPVPEGRIHDPG